MRGCRRGGSARAPREWTLLAGLASGGHPSCVTQGQPQSGPGGKRASAPQSPNPHPHCLSPAAPCLVTSGTSRSRASWRSRPSLERSAALPSSPAGSSHVLLSSFPRGAVPEQDSWASPRAPPGPLAAVWEGVSAPAVAVETLPKGGALSQCRWGRWGVADRTHTTGGGRGPSSPTSLSLKKSHYSRG